MDALGKFGEHERSERVARGANHEPILKFIRFNLNRSISFTQKALIHGANEFG